MTPRTFVLLAAAALGIVAAILFLTPVTATTPGGADVSCGTVWKPDTEQADLSRLGEGLGNVYAGRPGAANSYDGFQAACSDARDSRGTWGYVLAGLCVFGLIGGGMVGRDLSKPPSWAEGKPEA